MKKSFILFMLCIAVFMTACNNTSSQKPAPSSAAKNITEEPTSTPADKEETDKMKVTLSLIHAMNNYFWENKDEYNPKDDKQYWTCLIYVSEMCKNLSKTFDYKYADGYYKVPAEIMKNFSYACFADRSNLHEVQVPEKISDRIYYNEGWDAYFVVAGDAGAVNSKMISFEDNKDGTYTAEVDFVDLSENNKLLAHFSYVLVNNAIPDKNIFPYSVKSVTYEIKK